MIMNLYETIKKRRSVRTFDGSPLKDDDLKKLRECFENAENPYGIKVDFKILDAKEKGLSSPVIVGTDTWVAGKTLRQAHAEEAFGYSFERFVLCAETLGIGTTWIAGTMDRGAFEKAAGLEDGEVMPCVSPIGYPSLKMSLRESIMRKGIKADSRLERSELFFTDNFGNSLGSEDSERFGDVFELVRLAPSAVNRQPWRLVVRNNTVHFYEKSARGYRNDSGWDIQKIDMGIAMCHFVLGIEEKGMTALISVEDPGIIVPDDTFYIASFNIR